MMFLGVKRGCLLLLAVLLASSTQASDAGDITLKALRAELANGGLAPVIAHHPLTTLPGVDLERLFADSHFQRFAITGYNSNGQRFAARVRLHFADGRVGFIRITGVPGREYRLEDLHDYTTGLSLAGLVAERRWLGSHEGKAFLEALGKTPESDTLAQLAGGRAAPLALWLAQCSGQPCEQTALEYQIEPTPPALWQLMVVSASSLPQTVAWLQKVLGDDPWLAWLVGDAALARQMCPQVDTMLVTTWLRHQDNMSLADVALQCFLATVSRDTVSNGPGNKFLDSLSDSLGAATLSAAIHQYFLRRDEAVPEALGDWSEE